ncbi:MAG: exonuclease domain-containing protein [Candidatus Saccharimonas sp.]
MFETPFVFVDIETNGGNGPRGRVIEVAAIKVEGGEIIDTYQSLINPSANIPHWITTLTGIDNGDLAQAPYFDDIAVQLYEFMDGCVFAAHNVLFDYSFLKREFKACDIAFSPKLFCTVKMSRALWPEHQGHSLEKVIARHNLVAHKRHRAYDDALAILHYTQLTLRKKGEQALRANMAAQLKTKHLPPQVDQSLIASLPETPGIYIFENNEGLPLYVGKSVNIRARVRSHFTNATSIAREMRLSLQSHNVTYITTETELEALLLESAKVKELQPVFNRKLRRKKTQHILVKSISDQGYVTIRSSSQDLSAYHDLRDVYGVYTTKTHAKNALESIARTYQLCPKLLGLEKPAGYCFRYQLGLCKGACGGKEQPDHYNGRVEFALERTKIETWPYASAVKVPISRHRSIVIDQWIPTYIIDHETDTAITLDHAFDLDTYKILRSFMRQHKPPVALCNRE